MKNCKKGSFLMKILVWKRIFAPGTSRSQDFLDFLILRYVVVFCVGLRMSGVYFLSFSFIFFWSIVVYLKLGSRLTFFFVIFFHFFWSIVEYLKLGSRLTSLSTCLLTFLLTFLLTLWLTFFLTCLLTFLLAFVLTFWLTRRREEEGRSEGVKEWIFS